MTDVRSTVLVWTLLASWLAVPAASTRQVELDRIVSRVGERIVTQSDVRQVRLLQLVEETSSDEATLRALESRLLVLHELGRAAPVGPISPEELAERRAEWVSSVGGGAGVPDLLRRAGMAEADLYDFDAFLQNRDALLTQLPPTLLVRSNGDVDVMA